MSRKATFWEKIYHNMCIKKDHHLGYINKLMPKKKNKLQNGQ